MSVYKYIMDESFWEQKNKKKKITSLNPKKFYRKLNKKTNNAFNTSKKIKKF